MLFCGILYSLLGFFSSSLRFTVAHHPVAIETCCIFIGMVGDCYCRKNCLETFFHPRLWEKTPAWVLPKGPFTECPRVSGLILHSTKRRNITLRA